MVPVFNAERSLVLLLERLGPVLQALGAPFEILLVEDGSRDNSWAVIDDLAVKTYSVRGVRLLRNYGQHSALLCGIRLARFTVTVTLDDDLQNPPEEIPTLLRKLGTGLDVVYGVAEHKANGPLRNIASEITRIVLQKAMGAETARNVSAFRAFRTDLREAFSTFQGPNVSIDVLLTWGASRFGSVQVKHDARKIGVSNYSLGMLLAHALNMLTGYSTIPLQLASLIGIVFTFFGLLVLSFVLLRFFLQGDGAPGFPFLASIIAIFSGAQLFALGIVGEYIARIHLRSMDKPSYAVRCFSQTEPAARSATAPLL